MFLTVKKELIMRKLKGAKRFNKFRRVYKDHSESVGVLKNYLGLETSDCIPIGITHGIDFGQSGNFAVEINLTTPMHWSYNQVIHNKAKTEKLSVKIPHPFLLISSQNIIKSGNGTLLIGPVPSKENDMRLKKILDSNNLHVDSILIKQKEMNTYDSIKFWKDININTVMIDKSSLHLSLFNILNEFDNIIYTTFSSVVFFAAAIGKKCQLIRGYKYRGYAINDHAFEAIHFLKEIVEMDSVKLQSASLELLGGNLTFDRDVIMCNLNKSLDKIQRPVYTKHIKFNWLIILVSWVFGKRGWLTKGVTVLKDNSKKVLFVEIDEIDVLLNGRNKSNLSCKEVKHIKGVNDPGMGA